MNSYDSTPQAMLSSGQNVAMYQAVLEQLQGFARPLRKHLAEGQVSLYDFVRTINAPDKVELSHRVVFNTPADDATATFTIHRRTWTCSGSTSTTLVLSLSTVLPP